MLAYDPSTNPLNTNEWAFPLTECFHLASMALSIGLIGVVDLRLMGAGLTRSTPAQLLKTTELWTIVGLIIVITSGLVIFSSDPVHYIYNGPFQFKVTILLVAILFNYTIHRKIVKSNQTGAVGLITGLLSIALWLSPVFGGILIAFV